MLPTSRTFNALLRLLVIVCRPRRWQCSSRFQIYNSGVPPRMNNESICLNRESDLKSFKGRWTKVQIANIGSLKLSLKFGVRRWVTLPIRQRLRMDGLFSLRANLPHWLVCYSIVSRWRRHGWSLFEVDVDTKNWRISPSKSQPLKFQYNTRVVLTSLILSSSIPLQHLNPMYLNCIRRYGTRVHVVMTTYNTTHIRYVQTNNMNSSPI